MVSKADIEQALQRAGVEVLDETPGRQGGWFYTIAEMSSGHYPGKIDAIIAGLRAAYELERLCQNKTPAEKP